MFVAWVWSILWYLALDPLRWALAWCLNENGMRNRSTWRSEQVGLAVVGNFWPVYKLCLGRVLGLCLLPQQRSCGTASRAVPGALEAGQGFCCGPGCQSTTQALLDVGT